MCGFQLLEEGLKTYIQIYHNAVRAHLPPELTYRYSVADVEGASLGKIVSVFSKTSARNDLIEELRSLTKSRDELAHSAFRKILSPTQSEAGHLEKVAEFKEITKKVTVILLEIGHETVSIMSHGNTSSVASPVAPEA